MAEEHGAWSGQLGRRPARMSSRQAGMPWGMTTAGQSGPSIRTSEPSGSSTCQLRHRLRPMASIPQASGRKDDMGAFVTQVTEPLFVWPYV